MTTGVKNRGMQAIVQHAYGTTDVLRLQEVHQPTPRPHEVLVRVHAASLNHADWFITTGRPYVMRAALGLRRPRVAVRGRDLAGRVETVGAAVTGFRPGDEVYAETTTGSFAEYACVPERLLAPKPTPTSPSSRPPQCRSPPSPPFRVCATSARCSPARPC